MGREENQVRVAFEIDDNYFDRYYELSAIVTQWQKCTFLVQKSNFKGKTGCCDFDFVKF